MKKILFLLLIFSAHHLSGQDFSGLWHGALNVNGSQLRLSIDLTKNDTGYTGKLISIDQGNATLPLLSVKAEGPKLSFKGVGGISYTGTLTDASIKGTFTQNGQNFPMEFGKQPIEKKVPKRPQEPKPPFPYISEDISFRSTADSIQMAGTLTLPSASGKFPVVILISGSGPQNRNEELMGHKPFLLLSDHLTRNGIAVLRYDDRGVAKSKGNFNTATSANFADDVDAAIAFLKTRKEIDAKKIGLVGHSEGGLIAPMVAARNKDVAFIVLMAGPGVKGKELLPLQIELLAKASGAKQEDISNNVKMIKGLNDILTMNGDTAVINSAFRAYLSNAYKALPDSLRSQFNEFQFYMQYANLNTPWMKYFLAYDPAPALEKLRIPVLALNGSKDLQVWAPQNLPAIEQALKKAGNKKYVIKTLPGLNHLFQECNTGSSSEYAEIEQTLSPALLDEVTSFLRKII
jgi:uncharacterized protein